MPTSLSLSAPSFTIYQGNWMPVCSMVAGKRVGFLQEVTAAPG